jgi:hypothetical protein
MYRAVILIVTLLLLVFGYQTVKRLRSSQASPQFTAPNGVNLEQAVQEAEMSIRLLLGKGDLSCQDVDALSGVVRTMNASQGLFDDDVTMFRKPRRDLPRGIPYVSGRPTAPWQVVLAAKPSRRLIRVDGYGAELSAPLVSRDITCR